MNGRKMGAAQIMTVIWRLRFTLPLASFIFNFFPLFSRVNFV